MYHHKWSVSIDELERSIQEATSPGCRPKVAPRVLAVINPGNPTGKYVLMVPILPLFVVVTVQRMSVFVCMHIHVYLFVSAIGQHLSEDSIREIVHFCKKYNLLLIADEVCDST